MNIETALYISKYYHQFFNEKESIAHRHINSLFKLNGKSNNSAMYKFCKRKGWIKTDKDALELIENGETAFFIQTSNRILKEHKSEVFLNHCPNCKKLARTPKARQCRHCGNKWFDSAR